LITEQKCARNAIDYEARKHRMTYERAGYIFRAMKLENIGQSTRLDYPSSVPFGILWDASDMGLVFPDDGTFGSFLDLNADRLQLFDEEPCSKGVYFNPSDPESTKTIVCIYESDF
jgi:hypothetical protein